VTVTKDGVAVPLTRYAPVDGYGRPTLVFDLAGTLVEGTYTVTVSGIRGAGARSLSYRVRLFTPA
jgi:hypothetical protein